MHRVAGRTLVVVVVASIAAAEDSGKHKPPIPAHQYKTLRKEYQVAEEASAAAKTDQERLQIFQRKEKIWLGILQLAEKNPLDPVAVDALIWLVNKEFIFDSPRTKATALLLRDHVRSDRLGEVCRRMGSLTYYKDSETFLRTVLQINPHKKVKGLAYLTLAQFLNNGLRAIDVIKADPKAPRRADLWNNVFLDELQRRDRTKVLKEVEALFEQAAEKYGDVKRPDFSDTVGDKAKAELFELRHLAIGKQAPEIEGTDQEGKKFKLSDTRGKVVLLDFWSDS
jgi:hypothetical protein